MVDDFFVIDKFKVNEWFSFFMLKVDVFYGRNILLSFGY